MKKNRSHQLIQDNRLTKIGFLCAAILWCILTGVFVYLQHGASAQSTTAKVYTNPSSGSYQVGQTFSVAVRVSLDNAYNAASTNLYYNKSTMTYVKTTLNGNFNGDANTVKHNASAGYIELYDNRTSNGPLRGTQTLATVTFKVKAAGGGYTRPANSKVVYFPTATYNVQNVVANIGYTFSSPAPPPTDVCPNIAGTQTSVPSGYVKDGNGNCVKPTPTPTPSPTPTPTPTPTPSPAPAPTNPPSSPKIPAPSIIRKQPIASVPATSKPSQTGQQITDVSVSELDFRRATIKWKTTKPSASKINFSTNKDDLWYEEKDEQLKTDHQITLEDDKLRAGQHYYFRISADDSGKNVTVDGEFETKSITVIISVTDEESNPIEGATVVANEQTLSSDENGEVQLDMPEGEQFISAEKDELSREIYASISVPDGNEATQRISLMLSENSVSFTPSNTTTKETKKGMSIWLIILLLILFLVLLFFIIRFLLIKRRAKKQDEYIGDPLEAENYTQNVIPGTPAIELPSSDPQPIYNDAVIQPNAEITADDQQSSADLPSNDSSVPHHTTLPEMLGRYGASTEVLSPPDDNQVSDTSPVTGQPIPHHTSLKDLVKTPEPEESFPPLPGTIDNSDLPVAPESHPEVEPQPSNHKKDASSDSSSDELDGTTLSIKH